MPLYTSPAGEIQHIPPAIQHYSIPVPHRRTVEAAWAELISSLAPSQARDLAAALETIRLVAGVRDGN